MKPELIAAALARSPLFSQLDEPALLRLAGSTTIRTYRKGQLVFLQGEPGESLYVVAEGLLKLFVVSEEGEEMVLSTIGPPEIFGELAVIDGRPRSTSAEVLEPARLIALTRSTLLDLLGREPKLADALLRSIGARLRRLTEKASDLVFLDLHGRVVKLLLQMAGEQGPGDDEHVVLDLHVTQSDLAAMVGGSRQRVNQILHAFEEQGRLELSGRQIVFCPRTLRATASSTGSG
ncbi:MAG TPA: Crp/Fnr family transcriptional regulator [Actinomycetota bacterium]|nr:Crp/Fnr family transcriptional regulator [Actinomycetota bacterium]